METPFQREYREKVADELVHARESGNSYAGSEKSSLSMLLETRARENADLAGKRGDSGNYGRGCKAKATSWTVQEEWRGVVKKFGHFEKLQHRRPVSLADYETLHEGRVFPDGRKFVLEPENEFVLIRVTPQGYGHYKIHRLRTMFPNRPAGTRP